MTSKAKHMAYVAAGMAVLLTASIITDGIVLLQRQQPYDVLGDYEVQSVDEVTSTEITVTGTKCVNGDQPISISGTMNWQRVIPPGVSTTPATGVRKALPGCTTTTFTNTIPADVLSINEPGDVWLITGTEWPINPDTGRRGEPRTWQTENFTIPITP